jgi:serine/threonine-protein kinase
MGPYTIESLVARGGLGLVLRANDPRLGRKVAIKVVDDGDGESLEELLVGEARSLARLSHPNIVPVFDVGRTKDGRVWVAMEFVDGPTMEEWTRNRPWREVLAAWLDVGSAVRHAHEVGILHRDIKPSNVMVDRGGRVRVLDFGLTRDREAAAVGNKSAASPPSTAPTGEVVGTWDFMAPELFRGEPVSALSDQFSLCVSIYRALYGKDPYEGAARQQWVRALPAPPRAQRARLEVADSVEDALLRGMDPNPEWRFPSVSALVERLGEVLREAPMNPHERVRARVAMSAAMGVLAVSLLAWSRVRAPESFGPRRLVMASLVTVLVVSGGSWLLRAQLFRTPFTRKITTFANLFAVTALVHRALNAARGVESSVTLSGDAIFVAAGTAYLAIAHDRLFFVSTVTSLAAAVGCALAPSHAPLIFGASQGVAIVLYAYRAFGSTPDPREP